MKSEIVYFDENGKRVSKEMAVRAVIREFDEDGSLVREIFGNVNNSVRTEDGEGSR